LSRAVPRGAIVVALAFELLAAGRASAQTDARSSVPLGSFTLGAEALSWWFKGSPTPVPLSTDGPLGEPETTVLLGGGQVRNDPRLGFRLTAGYALDGCRGLEGTFLYVPTRTTKSGVSSSGASGTKDLLLPYFDVLLDRETATQLSLSSVYSGSIQAELTGSMTGAELSVTWATAAGPPWQVDLLGGLRWLRLREVYTITTSSSYVPPNPLDIWDTTDRFETLNDFLGAQVGARARYQGGAFFASGTVKLGAGAMRETVDISGALVTNDFTGYGPTQTFAGGYFAHPSNIGRNTRTVFAVVPEVGLNVGFQITPSVSVQAGYTLLYASDVVRPGDQVDRRINTSQSVSWVGEPPATLVGPASPSAGFQASSFWAQAVSLGLSVRF